MRLLRPDRRLLNRLSFMPRWTRAIILRVPLSRCSAKHWGPHRPFTSRQQAHVEAMPSRELHHTQTLVKYTSFCQTLHKSMDSNARPSSLYVLIGRFGGGRFYASIRQKNHSQTMDEIRSEMGTSPHRRDTVGGGERTIA